MKKKNGIFHISLADEQFPEEEQNSTKILV
jgi:hypothetical protein